MVVVAVQGAPNSLFNERSGNYDLFSMAFHGQSSRVSPQPGTHPFQHHPDRKAEAPEFGWIPEMESMPSSKNRIMGSKNWPCHHDGCNKSYGQCQEAIRHMRDKHEISHKCFICGIKWTRAEKIKKHLLSRHQNHFIEEERQEIRDLQGLNNTINFLERTSHQCGCLLYPDPFSC
jgi:hypothetical protein